MKTIAELQRDITEACYTADIASLKAQMDLEVARIWLRACREVRK